jgi:hypothetical protein
MAPKSIQKQNVGNAGEYYVASRLSALDYTVTITLGRAEKYDLLALSPSGKLIKVSVKTTQVSDAQSFPLSDKDTVGQADDFFYVFVKLNNFSTEPDCWVIPSNIVCPLLKYSHEFYLNTLGKKGQEHEDSSMRKLPVIVNASQNLEYPGWSEQVATYYKNFSQFENLW